jgi:hypothetical protein
LTLAASPAARIRDKYGCDHAAVADVEAWPAAETPVDGHRIGNYCA